MFENFVRGQVLVLSKDSELFGPKPSKITKDNLGALKEFLQRHPYIQSLNVYLCDLGDGLAEILKDNTTIHTVRIGGNNITRKGWNALAENIYIKNIDLSWSSLGDSQISDFARAYAGNNSLQTLNLKFNKIGNEGATILANWILDKQGSEKLVNPYQNDPDDVKRAVGEILANIFSPKSSSGIRKLDIGFNLIGEEGARQLADVQRKISILSINVGDQQGAALPNSGVVNKQQWSLLKKPQSQNPQKRAELEREIGLHPEIPSLQAISFFKVVENLEKEFEEAKNRLLITERHDPKI